MATFLTLAVAAALFAASHLAAPLAAKTLPSKTLPSKTLPSKTLPRGSASVVKIGPGRGVSRPGNCSELSETLTRPRWLSLPMSRLVVNPTYTYSQNAAPQFTEDALPLDLAYYAGAAPARLPSFLSWQLGTDAGAGEEVPLTRTKWQRNSVTGDFTADGQVHLAATAGFGSLSQQVTVDLDRTPSLLIEVPSTAGAWAVKVSDGDGPDIALLPDTSQAGVFLVDIPAKTGWHGTKTFTLRLYVIGGIDRSTLISRLRFAASPALGPRAYTWAPQEVTASGTAADGSVSLEAAATMPDADTVLQRLRVLKAGTGHLRLTGRFPNGTVAWDEASQTLRLQGIGWKASVVFSRTVRWLGTNKKGIWAVQFDGVQAGSQIVTAARFGLNAVAAARAQASPAAFAAALAASKTNWNAMLAQVPRPADFTPRLVDAKGVTAAEVRRSYYRAWVFFFVNTLPPMPENGFPYPQVCTGKPALWTDGGTHTEETALWDAAVAMQALTLVKPHLVWSAALGMMSQVAPDGYLNGEALPTIFSRTLWLLYVQTGDAAKLRTAYPALKRFLVWKIANPRWVYPNRSRPADDPHAAKDQEFVSHEIVDLDYAAKIADTLGMPEDAALWRQERQTAVADYLHWFWPVPGGPTYNLYVSDTLRSAPDNPWCLQGLQVDPSLLPAQDNAALVALYKKDLNPALPFLVPGRTRFGDLEPIALGLFRHGEVTEAARLADASLRDVTRAGEFSENYTQDNPPAAGGVRPSAFGAGLMTDSVFWHNGVVLDEGLPVLLGMPGAVGVDNIPVCGDPITVRFGAAGQQAALYQAALYQVTLTGPGLKRLHLPPGFHALPLHGGTVWTGLISAGQQVPLEGR